MKINLPISDEDLQVLKDELEYRKANPQIYKGDTTLEDLIQEVMNHGLRIAAERRKKP